MRGRRGITHLAAGGSWSQDWAPVSGHGPPQRLRQVLDPMSVPSRSVLLPGLGVLQRDAGQLDA